MRITVATAVACLLGVGISTAHDAQAAIKQDTTIPAQGLGSALKQLAGERDIQLVYRSEVVGERQTSGAVGELTFDEALTNLLKGTGLTYQYLDDRAVTIVPMGSSSAHASGPSTPASGAGVWERFRLAQAEQGAARPTGSSSGDIPRRGEIEEIIVTAQKRGEQRLQDVPISISVITADAIEQRGLFDSEDYLRGLPGVNQTPNPFGSQTIIIRGINVPLSGSAPASTYFGETSTTNTDVSSNSSIDTKLLDVERVEVLRGPQGTAFGSSSLSGTVRTIPMAPKLDRFEGNVRAGYSSTARFGGDSYNAQAVGNFPLIEGKLALRAVGGRFEESGYYRNVAGSDPAFQARAAAVGAQAFAIDVDKVGTNTTTAGRVAAFFQPTDALRVSLSYLKQRTELDGVAIATQSGYEQTTYQLAPEHARRGQTGGFGDRDLELANALLEYDLGWADLLATYSHIESWTRKVIGDFVGTGTPWSFAEFRPHRENSGEVRLATRLDGAWNFLAGLYAEDLDDENSFTGRWFGNPALSFAGPGQTDLGGIEGESRLKQKAAFGEVSWQFLPGVTLTGGVRAYDYDRAGQQAALGGIFGTRVTDTGMDASGTTFRGNLSYKPTEDSLLYAGWAQGFRLGRAQGGLLPGECDLDNDGRVDGIPNLTLESTRSVESDAVDNYELGGKFTLLNRRLSVAADVYRMDWTDMPFTAIVLQGPAGCPGASGNRAYTTNAGEAKAEGLEFQTNFYVTSAFRIDLGGSYGRVRLTKDVPAQGLHAGDRLPSAPEYNANLGLQYEFGLGDSRALVRLDPIYVGGFYTNISSSDAPQRAGGYVKVDASLRVAFRRMTLDLFGRNLTNSDEFADFGVDGLVSGPSVGSRLRPRTIGLQLGYNF